VDGRADASAAVFDESTRRVDLNARHRALEEVLMAALAGRTYERIARRVPEAHTDAQVQGLRARWLVRAREAYDHCVRLGRGRAPFDALKSYCESRLAGLDVSPSTEPATLRPAPREAPSRGLAAGTE
jgi:hypothetical protein